jgi:hypothetical protein
MQPLALEVHHEKRVKNLFFNQLTLWHRVLLEELIVTQLVKKFIFYGTQRIITAITKAHHWFLYKQSMTNC